MTAVADPAVAPAPVTFDPAMVAPFLHSVRNVFTTMVKVPTTVERPHLKASPGVSYDVSSIIGFSGDVVGSVVLSFQQDAAVKLVAAFAGMEMPYGSADFTDAVGELANMVAGGAKSLMKRVSTITVPTVVIGPGHILARLSDVPCIVLPCVSPAGRFAVEVNIKDAAKR